MTSADVTVRRTREVDWEEYRALRLEMLADTPSAFGETLANAGRWDETEWRMRSARGEASDQILVAAIDNATGRWVGSMGGFVASAMLRSVEEWATTVDRMLHLHVHEDNPRALTFYEREGYRLTGRTEPYVLNPEQLELEMVKELR